VGGDGKTGVDKITELISRRSGTVAALAAVAGFVLGSSAAYRLDDGSAAQPILLRQAVESEQALADVLAPGAGGALILLRNDSTVPVEVADAAFSRTTAAPPLYIAPETVSPGAEVNVYVPLPGACNASALTLNASAQPTQVLVDAHRPGTPEQLIPVEISGKLAAIMRTCHRQP
jgi:hypothetical protein